MIGLHNNNKEPVVSRQNESVTSLTPCTPADLPAFFFGGMVTTIGRCVLREGMNGFFLRMVREPISRERTQARAADKDDKLF